TTLMPAVTTTPEQAARTRDPAAAAKSAPRCAPARHGASAEHAHGRATAPETGRRHAPHAGAADTRRTANTSSGILIFATLCGRQRGWRGRCRSCPEKLQSGYSARMIGVEVH